MDKIVTVKPSQPSRFLDKHRSELVICLRFPLGLYLLWLSLFVLLPYAFGGLMSGGGDLFVWAIGSMLMGGFCFLAGVKLLVAGTMQLMIVRSLKSMQFAKTKRLCLTSMRFLQRWPLVRSAELSFFEIGLGAVCMGRADYEEAEQLFASAVDRYRKLIARHKRYRTRYYPNMTITLCHLSRAYVSANKFEEAESTAGEALEFARGIGQIRYRRMELFPLHAMALCHLRSGELDKAEMEYEMALKIYDETRPLPSYGTSMLAPILMACRLGQAIIAIKKGKGDSSLAFWKEYINLEALHKLPGSPSFLRAYNMLAAEYIENKMLPEAEQVMEVAYSVARHFFDHPDAVETLNCYEKLLRLTGRESEVKDMRAWLRQSLSPAPG